MNSRFLILLITIISSIHLSFQKDENSLMNQEIISLNEKSHFEGNKSLSYAFYFKLNEEETRENIIIYTDNDVNTKVVEVEKGEKKLYYRQNYDNSWKYL